MENGISIYQQFILQCLQKVHWEEFCLSIPQEERVCHTTQGHRGGTGAGWVGSQGRMWARAFCVVSMVRTGEAGSAG